ncbi:MAG: copper oxidase [Rhodobiaceae bacterium]|nr:copper oxidase [Rhodobiaceae bacterium]
MARMSLFRGLVAGCVFAVWGVAALAETHSFEMTIEDAEITLVGSQTFHTFAFDGQVPGPLLHVKEGDDLEVHVTNFTTLPHTVHWHGMFQKDTWLNQYQNDTTQKAIAPGETYTYRFKASPAGTMWYHCHVNVNEHVSMRGMWGPFVVDPEVESDLEKSVTKDFILMFSSWASAWAHKPGEGGVPGDTFDYFTINGKSFPETQPMRVREGDVVRMRLLGVGDSLHSIHLHGHTFDVVRKDGHLLPQPYKADTLLLGPGERYDIIFEANNPGRRMVHDHIDMHTVNGNKPHGGIMSVVEYEEVGIDDDFYVWKDKEFQEDFYYENALTKPHGLHHAETFRGEPVE